ncbi:methyltransferase [Luteolibacter pohnpeiensis]|uniref:Methyltransferase n=2 Tax=Luteolibacter pohnpeiensis TaxID=454153 RepID=A0A934S4D3_9BACT|nr:methyltransferase [Luteolibacter pohnpeiensis]
MDCLFKNLDSWNPEGLRMVLNRAGFHRTALQTLGLPENWLRSAAPRAALLGRSEQGSNLELLLRLFTLGDPLDGGVALQLFGDVIHGLLEIGLLTAGSGQIRSRFQISPVKEGWMACDFPERQCDPTGDYVMGVSPSTLLLSSLTPVVGKRALELASGIGWQSGNLVKAGMSVVAVDVNARALELGKFSARLCGIDGIDFRLSDGFSAVQGETFDLIVANPPYVQSPGGGMIYKEAPVGESICARLLKQLPDFLEPGGIAVVILNWSHTSDDDWSEVPLSWVAERGVRRWLFQSDCSSPGDYAWRWISTDLRFADDQAIIDEMRRWLTHYQQNGINRISGGFLVLQKCEPGDEWTRADSRSPGDVDVRAGQDVLRVLNNQTWLNTDPDLLTTRYSVPDGIRSEVSMGLAKTGWERQTIRLISPARLSYDGQIDENILRLLALAAEGNPPLAMVEEVRSKPELAGIPDLEARITDLVRELVSHGMLVPC